MSSAALGKLINLHKKLTGVKGKMSMCNVIPQIYEVFTITKLDKIFKIFPDEDGAMGFLN
jgi:anti-sigma B factor antagonist